VSAEKKESVAVVGAGSWGTAFAAMLAERHESVTLWAHEAEVFADLRDRRENGAFLPGIALSPAILPTNDLAEAVSGKTVVIFAVPSHHLREVAARAAAHLSPGACLVSLAKGVENGTLKRMTEVLAEVSPSLAPRIAALSGPTFAREVAEGKPTGATVAARDLSVARRLQQALSGSRFRLYADDDVTGIEIGGALKNVMAIASGMINGLGYGFNTTASLVTRANMEISRLGIRLGARAETFWGLAGIGDLMLTCFGSLSRNFQLGRKIALGESLAMAEESTPMVAEGVETAKAVHLLAEKLAIDMPISREVHQVLFAGKDVRQAITDLMKRSLKNEWNLN